jgi:SagB-type dehydrogenase family enzyme
VTGLAPGIYRYRPQGHEIEKMADGDKRSALAEAALGQSCVRAAPVSFVFSAVIERTRAKYGERAERYVWIEAGHAAQNVLLQAVSLNLGAVPVGAFRDDRVKAVLSLGEGEEVLYIVAIGKPRSGQKKN